MARTAVATKTPTKGAVAVGYRNQSVSVSDGTTDQDYWWLQALQQGNDTGLQWLLDQYGTWIYSKAYRMLQSHEDAEEAWQDIFMRVWQKIDLWDPERGNFQSWLNQIAKNAIIDIFRKRSRVREVLQHGEDEGVEEMLHRYKDDGPLPDELLENKETRELIEQGLELMTKSNHRVAWTFRHLEGMSIAEIGNALNQKENTVKVWIFRGTRELRQILVRRGFDFDQYSEDGDEQV
ncbi:RNA polymerase sigma factor [Candidatus Poribacteria bacterium]|jgi:RNA polymerase sigma-70 factor, ECF subfamily|nr:RNA polymerase sigma factor [Candidatus Poribacteria bacterium]MBT5532404.1 RNA polymerase sigma factor [Candidatus Poribacteria bacterium]MBT5710582.1 RNA polymerase sigma factor [Candidatus Poribacteria bacterium]MBT7098713.1 RNA polymerase sigma factor [Candidatus Poribacteria bacterium]MBT7807667.1 RNA polymerase sigma factor [Candidatus Poribacteria bacterium]